MLSPKKNVVAVHSRRSNLPSELIEIWYKHAIDWLKSLGVEPEYLSCYGVPGFKEAHIYSFKGIDKKLRSKGFDCVGGISLSAVSEFGILGSPRTRIEATLVNSNTETSISSLSWSWNRQYSPLNTQEFKKYYVFALELGMLDYAFADMMRKYDANSTYLTTTAFDVVKKCGKSVDIFTSQKQEALRRGSHVVNYLSDIHPFQVLNEHHLSYGVEGETLKEWISISGNRGNITKVSEGLYLWAIEPNQIKNIRSTLVSENLLTSCISNMSEVARIYGKP